MPLLSGSFLVASTRSRRDHDLGSVAASGLGGGAAPGAGADDLQRVVDVGEAVLDSDLGGPPFHRRGLNLHGVATVAAEQVVMVGSGGAASVDGLAVVGAHRVDLPPVD